ncbi:hypothetical protein [Bacillus sp. 3255]|uniref:hypothetical protein n=1 Tax=Bacillus sp. 3255 TaxID=2817904 RepID=UPI00286132AF|nr:hypothetical protein [Bacillus sp. 3255]MDR6884304.1 hypothetical protein [Bacillus sp. 3255]
MEVLVEAFIPEFQLSSEELNPLQRAVQYNGIAPCLIIFGIVVIGAAFYLPLLYLLLPIGMLAWYRQYSIKHTRWGTYRNELIISKQGMTKTTVYLLRRAMESVVVGESSNQKLWKIKSIKIDMDSPSRGSEYKLVGLSAAEVNMVLE